MYFSWERFTWNENFLGREFRSIRLYKFLLERDSPGVKTLKCISFGRDSPGVKTSLAESFGALDYISFFSKGIHME